VILDRMAEHGVRIDRVINAGGIPQRGDTLNRVYANVLNKPVLVPAGDVTSLGSAIFAFLAAGTFKTIEEAQAALCPSWKTYEPQPEAAAVYETLFPIFRKLYFALGEGEFREALPRLRAVRDAVRS
jgi:L-ribulokinase